MLKKHKFAYLSILPPLFLIFFLRIYPMIWTIYLSFYKVTIVGYLTGTAQEFAGLQNYLRLFNDADFLNSLSVSSLFIMGSVSLQFFLGLGIAFLINEKFKGRTIIRGIILMSYVVSAIVAGFTWRWLLAPMKLSIVNYLLEVIGLRGPQWLSRADTALYAIIIGRVWNMIGFTAILQLAALQSIPQDLYEASKIDGATMWKRFWYIILPLLKPSLLVNLIFITLWTTFTFSQPLAMTGGGPGKATELIAIYTYNRAFTFFEFGYAAAIAMFTFLLNIVFITIYFKLLKSEAYI